MAINLERLKEVIAKELSASGEAFETCLTEALRSVARDLVRDCFLDITPTDINAPTGNLDLDDQYHDVVMAGVRYKLQQLPLFAKKSEFDFKAAYDRERALAQYMSLRDSDPEAGIPEGDE